MQKPVVLASSSVIRQNLLRQAGVKLAVLPARIDETTIRASLDARRESPSNIADALAEHKARKISKQRPDALVIGCDQVLALDGRVMTKPQDISQAMQHLRALRGKHHDVLSAVVICQDGRPVWRHIGKVRLTMRVFSDTYMKDYLTRNWLSVNSAVGCYKLEEEGVRLFSRIEGDYFNVLGLPLLEVLNFLTQTGAIEG